ncbi:MAG: hypothetical protein RIS09_1236 [Actinomycetota bacterium]|jgi:pimeloyl-ACP methyl ester carboxylesterase
MNIVLLHAFPFDHRMWLKVAEGLSESGHDVVLPDLRGLGEAPEWEESEPASLQTLAKDVIRVLDALSIDRAFIGGCSLGGYVSLEALKHFPERVQGLILADTKASADTNEQRAGRERLIETIRSTASVEPVLAGIEHRMLSSKSLADESLMFEFHEMLQDVRSDGVWNLLYAMSRRESYFDVLHSCDRPILSLRGQEDKVSAKADHEAMIQGITDAKHIEIPDAGHLAPFEAPYLVTDAIRRFLETHPAG